MYLYFRHYCRLKSVYIVQYTVRTDHIEHTLAGTQNSSSACELIPNIHLTLSHSLSLSMCVFLVLYWPNNRCYLVFKSHGMENPLVSKHLNKDYYVLKLIYIEHVYSMFIMNVPVGEDIWSYTKYTMCSYVCSQVSLTLFLFVSLFHCIELASKHAEQHNINSNLHQPKRFLAKSGAFVKAREREINVFTAHSVALVCYIKL